MSEGKPLPQTDPPLSEREEKILLEELRHCIEWLRFLTTTMFQAWGFLIAADVALLGFAVSTKNASPAFLGTLVPVLMGLTAYAISRGFKPIAHSAAVLESRLGVGQGALIETILRSTRPSLLPVSTDGRGFGKSSDWNRLFFSPLMFVALTVITLAHLVVAFALATHGNWTWN